MAAKFERKEHSISMRLPKADIAMIDRAARHWGDRARTFICEAAVRAAEDVLMANRLVDMSLEGFAHFVAVLSSPPAAVPAMIEVVKRPAPWEKG